MFWLLWIIIGFFSSGHAEVPAPQVWTLFDGEVRLLADGTRGPYRLSTRALDGAPVAVWVNGVVQTEDRDFIIVPERAQITFLKNLERGSEIVVRFRQVPEVTRGVYRRRQFIAPEEEITDSRGLVIRHSISNTHSTQEESKLEVGGSKRIQVSFGSAQSHQVSQALQMHIAGEIADGVSVLAILSDRNLPVVEQGGTLGLRELDRVLFQVRGRQVLADVGDLDVRFDRTRFGRYHRQLQGAHVSVDRDDGQVAVVGAVSRGDWQTLRVVGIEGYQGPYQLPGAGGFLGAVVPESEQVYLNGMLMKRGEQLDYVIDYERGTVTFAPEQPIVTSSRILVSYQTFNEGKQSRLVGVDGQVILGDSGWRVGSSLIRESGRGTLGDLNSPGISQTHRQVTGVDAVFAPRDGVQFSGEASWSEDDEGKGHAVDLNGVWTSQWQNKNTLQMTGQFRRLSVGYEGFERVDVGQREGRWGWQPETRLKDVQEGEIGLRYTYRDLSIHGAWGRRVGDWSSDRRALGLHLPFGSYDYEHIGRDVGGLTRQRANLLGAWGLFRSGVRAEFERATGDGVAGASLFYASDPRIYALDGIQLVDLGWNIGVESEAWRWHSEMGVRRIRQQQTVWQDSLRAWSHIHQTRVNLGGLSVSGSYGQTFAESGAEDRTRRVTHLGRMRIQVSQPGYTQQMFYRVSSAGVQTNHPIYVEVGRGLGTHIWEDVDGDGEKDPEEFVADVDGDYQAVYQVGGAFLPVREGVFGARLEMNVGRVMNWDDGFWGGVSLDFSLQTERQTESNEIGPWHLFVVDDDVATKLSQRDGQMRIHLFRYHKQGSLRLQGRWRDRLDRIFYGGGLESLRSGELGGRLRIGRNGEVDGEITLAHRNRTGTEAFAYSVGEYAGFMRAVWRPLRKWDLRLGLSGGQGDEEQRDLRVRYISVQPEIIRRLAGRGRLRARLDWTGVEANREVPLFLGMAEGNRVGQNWIWRVGMDYRFGRYVTALISYDGRKRPTLPVIHLGRMEMRAVF